LTSPTELAIHHLQRHQSLAPVPCPVSSLRRGVAWTGAGNFIYLGCQYGMLMMIAKLGDPAAVGRFALALAVAAPIIVLSQMQLRQLQATDVRGEARFGDYLWHRLLLTLAALLVIGVIATAHEDGQTGLVIALVGAAKAFESLSDVAYGRLQRNERMDLVAVSMAAKGIMSLIVIGLMMATTGNLAWAVAGLAGTWALLLCCFDLPVQRRVAQAGGLDLRGRPAVISQLARTAMPLAWTSGLISLSANIPRYFLDGMHGKESVAIFAIAAAPLILANMLVGSVAQATLPRASTFFQTGELAGFHRLGMRITVVNIVFGLACAAGFALAGEWMIVVFFTPEYTAAVPLIVIMSIGTALGGFGAYGGIVLAAGRRFSLQLCNVILMVALQLVVSWVLIGRYGVLGAGWSELIRYAASALFLLVSGLLVMNARQRTAPMKAA
jgi:O-antigen/teichoic acid export membrane protein